MLKLEDLSLSYHENEVFHHVNLQANPGEVVVITGLSGCGKSSLLKIINGVIFESTDATVKGKVCYLEHDLLKENMATKSEYLSTVFQNPKTQFYCINSTDELAFGLENRAVEREKIIKTIDTYTSLLKTKDLLDKDIFSLSGGEKQLLAITAVTCLDNDIYLFDEPSASLDRSAIHRFVEVIKMLKKAGKIILIAEHRLYYLKDLLDRVAVIDDGSSYVYSREEFLHSFDRLSSKHYLRTIHEIEKNELKDVKQIQLLSDFSVQNVKEEMADLLCSCYDVKFDQPILHFSLGFEPGVYFIIGQNGVGKSTFVKTLCQLMKTKSKSFYLKEKIRKSYDFISMVMQDVNYQIYTESCFEELSVISNDEDLIFDSLHSVHLLDKKDVHPQTLSGGEKQRLLLAKVKVLTKPIVVLDEPTSGLDRLQMKRMTDFLEEMKAAGKVVLVITHDYELIQSYDGHVLEFIR